MPRTTLDLDRTVLAELKRRGRREGKSAGRLASELLADALAPREPAQRQPLDWTAKTMSARVDLEDKEALSAALDAS